jgi:hypothetical protein
LNSDLSQDLLQQDRNLQIAIFGAVHRLACVKFDTSLVLALVHLLLDYSQLWILLGDPEIGWTFNVRPWIWRVFRWLLFINPIIDKVGPWLIDP